MKKCRIDFVMTNAMNIEDAVKLYLAGKLDNLMDRLH